MRSIIGSSRQPECLLLAQSGHLDTLNQCPLSGVKRTLLGHCGMSAFDPKRTSPPCGGNATHTLLLRLTGSFPTYRFFARDSVKRGGEQGWGGWLPFCGGGGLC